MYSINIQHVDGQICSIITVLSYGSIALLLCFVLPPCDKAKLSSPDIHPMLNTAVICHSAASVNQGTLSRCLYCYQV